MITRLAGVVLDARAMRANTPLERALAARWIAANLLAARGVRVDPTRDVQVAPCVFSVYAKTLTATLAAIAAIPALLDRTTLPLSWRLVLQAVGMPFVDQPAAAVLASGASIAILVPNNANAVVTVATKMEAAGFTPAAGIDVRMAIDRANLLVA